MAIQNLLETAIQNKASDLHLICGVPPVLRIHGVLAPISGISPLTPEVLQNLIFEILSPEQKEILSTNRELDFSYELPGKSRFRINAYHQRGTLAAAFRLIPLQIKTIDELKLPPICHTLANLRQGFVLITGPTGHGKSTTLAAILEEINRTRPAHILTIEDPIEFILTPQKSIISQREVHGDSHSWNIALRSALREDPNVVLVGEMRDLETISAALTIAETGHLVFATLHTNSASQTIDRIVDVFPEFSKGQVKMQLSSTIEAVFSQRLIPSLDGGRTLAYEVMVGTPAVRNIIREGKTHLLDNVIQTSAELGMVSLDANMVTLVQTGVISLETAQSFALHPEELMKRIGAK